MLDEQDTIWEIDDGILGLITEPSDLFINELNYNFIYWKFITFLIQFSIVRSEILQIFCIKKEALLFIFTVLTGREKIQYRTIFKVFVLDEILSSSITRAKLISRPAALFTRWYELFE